MRLIDADALKKAMDGYWGRCQRIRKPRNGETAVFLDVMATVENQPTIDAVPVRHGKWKYDNQYHWYRACCSECGYCRVTDVEADRWNEWKYCPNCGARMDEE